MCVCGENSWLDKSMLHLVRFFSCYAQGLRQRMCSAAILLYSGCIWLKVRVALREQGVE